MTRHQRPAVATSLQQEWDRIRSRPVLVERARSWAVTDEPFDDLDGLLALAGFQRGDAECDAVLRRLVAVARTDELAARIVLQRILPGLMALARRRRRSGPDVLQHLVAAAWIGIRTFRPGRRPACIAAALVGDADHACFCRPHRRPRSSTEIAFDPATATGIADQRQPTPCEELAAVLGDARRAGVPDTELDLVQRLLAHGSTDRLAAELRVTARTVRNRRERVTRRLRQVALVA
jgi:hypothetical protein